MSVVIDDRLLLDVLARKAPAPVAAEAAGGGVFTTSAWYYRLGRAAFAGLVLVGGMVGNQARVNSLTRDLMSQASLSRELQQAALEARIKLNELISIDRDLRLARTAAEVNFVLQNLKSRAAEANTVYDHAIAMANATPFGMSASLFTADLKSALTYVRRMEAGLVRVNGDTTGVDPHAPFGGTKSSSSGSREQGRAAREFYTEIRTIQIHP